jgi:hypothetical protein
MDAETLLAVDRANQKALLGRTDWTPGEIQAAPWIATKGRDLAENRFGGDMLHGLSEAGKTYNDYYPKFAARATHEAIPGAMTGHLPGLPGASEAERAYYSLDPGSTWLQPTGHDVLYQAAGLYQQPALRATGAYTPPGGTMETNPLTVSRPMVAFAGEPGARFVDKPSQAIMNQVEAVRAYLDAQGAGAWSMPIRGNVNPNSLYLKTNGPLSGQQIQALQQVGRGVGLGDVIDYGNGAVMTSFGEPVNSRVLGGALIRGGLQQRIEQILPGAAPERVGLASGYVGYEDKWAQGQGQGVVTRELQQLLQNKDAPATFAKLDQDNNLRIAAANRLLRDERYSERTGQPVRPDIQNARMIISEGGFTALFQALKRGALLPVSLAPLVLGALKHDQGRRDRQ